MALCESELSTKYNISTETDLQKLKAEWSALERNGVLYYFQSFSWVESWFSNIGQQANITPLIVKVTAGDSLVALFTCCVEKQFNLFKVLTWTGGNLADYHAPIFLTGLTDKEKADITNIAIDYLSKLRSFDLLMFTRVSDSLADGSPNPLTLSSGLRASDNLADEIDAPYACLSDWESYYAKIDKKIRADSARQRRRLSELGELAFRFADDLDAVGKVADITIEQKSNRLNSMKVKDLFADQKVRSFYRDLAKKSFADSCLSLSYLQLNEEIIATHYGFLRDGRLYYLLPTYDDKYGKHSPGRLLMEDLIKWCCEKDVKVFDFCLGPEQYKYSWADDKMIVRLYANHITYRGFLLEFFYRHLIHGIKKTVRKGRKLLYRL